MAKDQGGLGIIDLRTQLYYSSSRISSTVLLISLGYNSRGSACIKDLLYFMLDPLWSVESLWWRDVMSLSDHFRLIATCKVNCGLIVTFWRDKWDLGVLHMKYP